jgi:hypothetical protein
MFFKRCSDLEQVNINFNLKLLESTNSNKFILLEDRLESKRQFYWNFIQTNSEISSFDHKRSYLI